MKPTRWTPSWIRHGTSCVSPSLGAGVIAGVLLAGVLLAGVLLAAMLLIAMEMSLTGMLLLATGMSPATAMRLLRAMGARRFH